MGEGPPPGGPQLPGGNLLVYPPDPSSRAGKLLHNRANSELRSLLVGPPTTTTQNLSRPVGPWVLPCGGSPGMHAHIVSVPT